MSCGTMDRTRIWFLATAVALCAATGCKEKRPAEEAVPSPSATRPAEVKPPEETAVAPARPATQELLAGPRKELPLEFIPLVATVPQSWKIDKMGGAIILLTGPAPHGDVQMQLLARAAVPQDRLEMMLTAATRPSTDPEVKLMRVRRIGPATMIERQTAGTTVDMPVLDTRGRPSTDAKGNPVTTRITPLRWTLTLYVPQSNMDAAAYELQFVNTTLEEYESDKGFLRQIVDGLKFSGTAASTRPAPGAASSPS